MPFKLRRASPSDVEQLTDVFFSGFRKDAVMASCFPEKPSVRRFWINGLMKALSDPSVHIVAVVDTDAPGEPIVAYANWVSPTTTDTDTEQDQAQPLYPDDGDDKELAEFFFPFLKEQRAKNMGGRKCWYLAALVCHEDHQGKGAGGMLMRYGLKQADDMNADIYLEASPPGVPVYKRFGFKEIDRVVVLDGQFTELLMLREFSG
ncbi:hypothetical protein UA08_09128 [Talaromyces atroroseus]|uniref:N-acetyltransferase domain-containing protein n=1 Tax=Talaromyces atroroseus TaxID=1441469 RepID=A0A1Q5Q7J2_TALAT|nr:hypothetical protein UA08_09128 [Talaromyces atroroseus]OKL55641.1 hypothetical protein UA08_09128 [Talaromyces atroroseus]